MVADSIVTIDGLANYFAGRKPLTVLVECGQPVPARCGVQTSAEAMALARRIVGSNALAFGGLMTYPKAGSEAATEAFFAKTLTGLKAERIDCPIVSNGGTPSLFSRPSRDLGHRAPCRYLRL